MSTYKRHRFPPEIISYAVWLYYRFNLSHPDIEDLLAERGITVSRESIRLWCIKFGAIYSRRLKRRHRGYGDTFYIDGVLFSNVIVDAFRKQGGLRAVFAFDKSTHGGSPLARKYYCISIESFHTV